MPRAVSKPTYAALSAALAKARLSGDLKRCEELQRRVDAIKATEMKRYPEHFRKSDEDKARLQLLGWLEGGLKALTRHHFPAPGSFLEEVCVWSLVALLRRPGGPPAGILGQVASLFVPDAGHVLAHPQLVARLGRRRAGAIANIHAVEQIVAAVATFERDGLSKDAAAEETAEWYDVSREYVYECVRNATPAIQDRKRRRRP